MRIAEKLYGTNFDLAAKENYQELSAVTWERSDAFNGPWVIVPFNRVPKTVVHRMARQLVRGDTSMVSPAYKYYYRAAANPPTNPPTPAKGA